MCFDRFSSLASVSYGFSKNKNTRVEREGQNRQNTSVRLAFSFIFRGSRLSVQHEKKAGRHARARALESVMMVKNEHQTGVLAGVKSSVVPEL